MKAEVMLSQAKELAEGSREVWNTSFSNAIRENMALPTP